ncbi:MAG: pyridoxal 5'-phosphate synthase glutaminase subunit PdxT [Caldisericia bacterium]|nr:pyridoxal 5'-phosphate synthase glutaminase subunit PdxT [Caldisericia bacterium]
MVRVGVLALQGAFIEHYYFLKNFDFVEGVLVKKKEDLETVDGLIIPGGESTTIGKLLERYNMKDILKEKIKNGFPVFGTCAGLILLSKKIEQNYDQPLLEVLDIVIKRNAFGSQKESMEIDLDIKGLDKPFRAVFIRAPVVSKIGNNVEVLAKVDEGPVLVKEGNIMGSSFHPELTDDIRIHKMFIDIILKRR